MRRLFTTLTIAFTFSFSHTKAQTSWTDRLYVEGNYHYGFILPTVKYIDYFINEHISGYQINIGLLSDGQKRWQQDYNYPRSGFGFFHSNLGNSELYGSQSALFFYIDRYYFRQNSRFNLGNRLEYGISYVNRIYDLDKNPLNTVLSSHLNVYLNYSIEALIRINSLLQLKLGLGISHISNGRFYEPNKGLNFLTTFAGLQYSLNDPNKYLTHNNLEREDTTKHKFVFTLSGAEKQLYRKMDNRYGVVALSSEYGYRIYRNGFLGLALNTYYDPSLTKEIELRGRATKSSDKLRISLNLSYEMQLGRFSYIFQPGIYLKDNYKEDGIISNRLGLRYALNQHWMTGITVKAHWVAIADFIEWGIGYKL
jgi:hypothetical protein